MANREEGRFSDEQRQETRRMTGAAREAQRRGGGGAGWIFILVALTLIIGPIAVSSALGWAAQITLVGLGVLSLLVGAFIVIISKLYVTATADCAFVRTGMGGRKTVTDGGALVISAVHRLTYVTLETMKIEIERAGGKEALLTGDSLRMDIKAEFYIRVEKKEEDVQKAATSIGGGDVDQHRATELLKDKLVSALRSVAVKHSLADLNRDRKSYIESVHEVLSEDLKQNGFTLETVTISYLDQTPMGSMNADQNIFDAEGSKMIAEVVNKRRIERNQIERDAEQAVATQNVMTRKAVLQTELDQKSAEAEQSNQVKQAQARAEAEARKQAAEQAQAAGVAEAESERAIQLAGVTRQQAVEVAEQERRKAAETAKVAAEQNIEVAKRSQEIAVAEAEAKRAKAQEEQLRAQAEREAANQAVETVKATADAERKKQVKIIEQQADSDKSKIETVVSAEAQAQSKIKLAEAERTAAEASAAAKRTAAEAERDAKKAEAEGKQAVDMVPVNVLRTKVEVERQELNNKNEYKEIASGLTLGLAKIEAEKVVRVALANSMGQAMAAAKITVWGDPSSVERLTKAFVSGQTLGQLIQGFEAQAPEDVVTHTKDALKGLGSIASSALKRLTGIDLSPDRVETILREEQEKAAKGGNGQDKGVPAAPATSGT